MALSRVIANIPTFFTNNNMIDYDAISNHINTLINSGVVVIVLFGNVSEASSLSNIERMDLVQYIHNNFHNNLRVIVQLQPNETFATSQFADYINMYHLADYFIMPTPTQNGITQDGIYEYFMNQLNITHIPIIISCNTDITAETINRLTLFNNLSGVADTSGNVEHVMNIIHMCPNLNVFATNDMLTLPIMSVGGYGVISTVVNIFPQRIFQLVVNHLNTANNNQQNILNHIILINNWCNNSASLKYIMSRFYNNMTLRTVRLPLLQINELAENTYNNLFVEIV